MSALAFELHSLWHPHRPIHACLCSQFPRPCPHRPTRPFPRYPAYLHVTDIAGLVRGASEGAGLGNAFLSHIAAVDGIFHVVRAFESEEVIHVDDSVDPVRDLETIQVGGCGWYSQLCVCCMRFGLHRGGTSSRVVAFVMRAGACVHALCGCLAMTSACMTSYACSWVVPCTWLRALCNALQVMGGATHADACACHACAIP